MNNDRLLSIDALTVTVEGRTILDGVACEVGRNQRIGILGPNGAGKSSLLHAIVGLMPISAGTIEIDGHPSHEVVAKTRFGWVPDDLPMADSLTGWEVAQLHARLRGESFDAQLCASLFDVVELADDLDRPCGDYSHGMRRKLSLVVALAHRPALLILDEPFRGLDPVTSALLRELLHRHSAGGRSVLMATHDLSRAAELCDTVHLVHNGRVVAAGSPSHLCATHGVATLEEAFLLLTDQRRRLDFATSRLGALLT